MSRKPLHSVVRKLYILQAAECGDSQTRKGTEGFVRTSRLYAMACVSDGDENPNARWCVQWRPTLRNGVRYRRAWPPERTWLRAVPSDSTQQRAFRVMGKCLRPHRPAGRGCEPLSRSHRPEDGCRLGQRMWLLRAGKIYGSLFRTMRNTSHAVKLYTPCEGAE